MTDLATIGTSTDNGTIRPFRIDVPQEAAEDMRRRDRRGRARRNARVTDDEQLKIIEPLSLPAVAACCGA